MNRLTAKDVLTGYRIGIFPMAESKNSSKISWIKPKRRGVIPIGKLHISRSLKKFIRSHELSMTLNTCFSKVVDHCADRPDTWINKQLYQIYLELYKLRYAVSIEIWSKNQLIGGLLGVKIGSCFCGESMFSLSPNGSKLALIVTMAHLKYNNFTLFDTQFITDHLLKMGGCEISQIDYERRLATATLNHCKFANLPVGYSWLEIMQLNNHTL